MIHEYQDDKAFLLIQARIKELSDELDSWMEQVDKDFPLVPTDSYHWYWGLDENNLLVVKKTNHN